MENFASKLWLVLTWSCVLILAALLRLEKLDHRPFHFDEATGARITEQRINPDAGYTFNPTHNHGPLLSATAAPISKLRGESTWQKMSKYSLRLTPVIFGILLVAAPILWRHRFGDIPTLATAALLATSPLLAYYSRMFIHEMLLTALGLLVVTLIFVRFKSQTLKFGTIGFTIGLMFATKETFAISIIAWSGAATILAISNVRHTQSILTDWKNHLKPTLTFILGGTLSAGWFYTNGFTRLEGAWDAVRTFFVYKTTAGHDKPFAYYLGMLIVPTKAAIWWHETLIFILAVISIARSFLPGKKNTTLETAVRFIAYSAAFHLLIYSIISYKTPWLMCLPWAHACLLAGLSIHGITSWKFPTQAIAILLLGAVIFQQHRLAKFATGRFETDRRNPYAYTPTSGDIESVRDWLSQMSDVLPPRALEPIAVVGTEIWPLPWYLRDYQAIGYWQDTHPDVAKCPLVFAMPETADSVTELLKDTHTALPRSLRTNVPVMMYLRNDHWKQWMNSE